ncbi:unnamed protein product [Ixodes pacificus]
MRALVILCVFAVMVGVALAGGYGGYGGGYGHGYHKTVAGPSFLVKTVHHVSKVSQGGVHSSHLIGVGGHGGGYGHGWH